MQTFLRDDRSSAPVLRNRSGFTALAVLMLSLGVGATTALFGLVDGTMPRSALSLNCETALKLSSGSPSFRIAEVPSRAEMRDRAADINESSVESADEAIGAFRDVSDVSDALGVRPILALLGACALGFLLMCVSSTARMVTAARAPLVAIGATAGALMIASLALHALELPAIGLRTTAFALCVSLIAVCFARISQRMARPLTN